MEESKALDRIGRVIKTHTFPNVVKNLGFDKASSPIAKPNESVTTVKQNIPLNDDALKFLPNLRQTSYQTYRQTPLTNEMYKRIEPINTSFLWRQETIIPISDNVVKASRPQRTQIIAAEAIFGKTNYRKKRIEKDEQKNTRREKIEKIYLRIQQRSYDRACEYMNNSL